MDKNILMKNLGLTADQAQELLNADKEVDRMSRIVDINSDLTPDQAKAAKKARSSSRKKSTFKFDTSNREKKVNNDKKELLAALMNAVADAESLEIINNEREFKFIKNGITYKVVLSIPRN